MGIRTTKRPSRLVDRLGRKLVELTADTAARWWDKSAAVAERLGQGLTACCGACLRPAGSGEDGAEAKEPRKGDGE
jgi:hypothetical protein